MNCFRNSRASIRSIAVFAAAAGLIAHLPACRPRTEDTASAQVRVTTAPPEAMVLLGGVHEGETPVTLSRVPPGEHLLIFRKPGYREARTTIQVHPGERMAVDISLEPVTGLLLVHSEPSGADVEINDASYGKTPLLIPQMPIGRHKVAVSAPGYLARKIDINVADRTPQKVHVSLVSDSARMAITSTPPGATVSVGGITRGTTPYVIESLPGGTYRFEIAMRGYEPYADEFTVHPGDDRELTVALTPLPGELAVVSRPERARVYLNGELKGETPLAITGLPAGEYDIRAELRGYESMSGTRTVGRGERTVAEFELVKNSGALLISTEPPGVRVYLDGEDQGTTESIGGEPVSTQLKIDLVPQGERNLQLTKPGHFDLLKTVEISPDRTTVLHEKLRARPVPFVPNVIIRTGPGPEHTFRGVLRDEYADGVIRIEIEPGIFKRFAPKEIISREPITRE